MGRGGRLLAVTTAAFLMVVMWVVAAPQPSVLAPPEMPLHLPSAPTRTAERPPPPTDTSTSRTATGDSGSQRSYLQITTVLFEVLAVVAFLLLVAAVVAGIRHMLSLRQPREEIEEFEALPEVPHSLVEDDGRLFTALRTGEARNAIVACWAQLEDATSAAGVPMLAHETSSEYTERVVGHWVRDDQALRELAALYRVARFSQHELGETEREQAAAALTELLRELRRTWEAARV